ncbi:MAG: NADH-quinone oxidoreductase subunit [Gaiellales bacterium]|jgi:NADH-quinone oxidoreductase subunit G|nr:NADH-quinone oxidoreductase subunit [Gaiellales bacterium]
MATVETDTVTLTIDGREVTVAKGLSLVEAAAEGGIEVPVFCYEPRIGPAIGACRMCLCEIDGMPKLQTACTTPAADGMVVMSRSDRAREGQDAVLEFLLLNHPLDCPVCDKGGECPLQDLTFRYGPGNTRMTLPKRTNDKPVPVSPLIKLDRERCILCYRCTRFSESVSGDLQLVTENRGAGSIITTFEGRPYDGEFSGNVTELCPVGALTSSPYRFRGRPWEIQNVPTVCGLCPVGCNTYGTHREGSVARVLSRNHPQVDEGWLCDKGRYSYPSLSAEGRLTTALIRGGRGLEAVAPATVLDHIADRLRATVERFGPGSVAILASGDQTSEEAYLWSRIQAEALGGGPSASGPESGAGWDALAPYAGSIADLDDADTIVVAGATDIVHRAPILELRIRRAAERGAQVATVGAGATRLETLRRARHVSAVPGTTHAVLLQALSKGGELAGAVTDKSVLIWNGRMSKPVGAVLAHLAHSTGARVLQTPQAANELGCHAAGLGTATAEQVLAAVDDGRVRSVVLLGADPVGEWPGGERWRAMMERAFFALHITPFQGASSGWATTVVPATMPLEKDGTFTNLEGRVQRLRPTVPPRDGVLDGLVLAAELGRRLGVELSEDPPAVFEEMATSRPAFAGIRWAEIGEKGVRISERPRPAEAPTVPNVPVTEPGRTVAVGYRQLMSGQAVDHAPVLHFQRRIGIEIAHDDAQRLGVATGDRVEVTWDGGSAAGPAVVQRRLRNGVVRFAADVPYVGPCKVRAADPETAGA